MLAIKTCTKCGAEKELTAFGNWANAADGLKPYCRQCIALGDRERRLRVFYKLTLEQFEEMAKNGCWACGSFEDLHVHHDHNCCDVTDAPTCGNCIDGILCNGCNRSEGLLGSDPDRALALAAFMLRTQNKKKMGVSHGNQTV